MKKNNIFRYLAPFMGVATFFVAMFLVNTLFAGVTGITYAMALAAGTALPDGVASHEAVRVASADLDVNHVSKKVAEMKPAKTPLDTIMRNVKTTMKINSFITEFYSVDSREFADAVTTLYTKGGDGVTSYALVVDNVGMWSVDDTAVFRDITGAQDDDDLVCLVIDKSTSGNTITIQPMNGDTGAGSMAGSLVLPTIAASTVIIRMGKAMNEMDAQAVPYAIVPEKGDNYCQIFMAQVEEGVFQAQHKKEVQWGFNEYSAQNIYDMKGSMEYSFKFGYQTRITQLTDSDERYLTGGVTREITETLEYGTGGSDRTINESDFVTWTKNIFTGNSGSDMRVLLMGDGLVSYISQIDTVSKQIAADKTLVKWGIKFNVIETNFGTLLCKHDPSLDIANWGDKGIVLDLNYVEKHVFTPMEIRELDLKTPGIRNANASIMRETSAMVIKYPDVHKLVAPAA